jgi:hypothetical protein
MDSIHISFNDFDYKIFKIVANMHQISYDLYFSYGVYKGSIFFKSPLMLARFIKEFQIHSSGKFNLR